MKLTAEQIECINRTLIKKGIKFDDLKIEVLDHIASQIESEMKTTQTTFPDAFSKVFERWNEEFVLTRAYFSLANYYPKLAKTKFGNQLKLELITAIAISLVLILSFQLLPDSNAKFQFVFWMKKVFFYAYFGTIVAMLIFIFLNQKSKISSTYKYLFDKRFVSIFCWVFVVFNDRVPNSNVAQNIMVLLMSFMFMFLISSVYLGIKHYQFQKKFAIQ
ncbi:MAG TPA: hypothetical protein DCS19_02620 [Flavobacterium sp.]|nr:hypothetical protein [Flavobacterium sp.]